MSLLLKFIKEFTENVSSSLIEADRDMKDIGNLGFTPDVENVLRQKGYNKIGDLLNSNKTNLECKGVPDYYKYEIQRQMQNKGYTFK